MIANRRRKARELKVPEAIPRPHHVTTRRQVRRAVAEAAVAEAAAAEAAVAEAAAVRTTTTAVATMMADRAIPITTADARVAMTMSVCPPTKAAVAAVMMAGAVRILIRIPQAAIAATLGAVARWTAMAVAIDAIGIA